MICWLDTQQGAPACPARVDQAKGEKVKEVLGYDLSTRSEVYPMPDDQ